MWMGTWNREAKIKIGGQTFALQRVSPRHWRLPKYDPARCVPIPEKTTVRTDLKKWKDASWSARMPLLDLKNERVIRILVVFHGRPFYCGGNEGEEISPIARWMGLTVKTAGYHSRPAVVAVLAKIAGIAGQCGRLSRVALLVVATIAGGKALNIVARLYRVNVANILRPRWLPYRLRIFGYRSVGCDILCRLLTLMGLPYKLT